MKRKTVIWISVVVFLMLAIALGVGLGVGLTQNDDRDSFATETIEDKLRTIAEENNFPALGAAYFNGTPHITVVGVRKIGSPVNASIDDVWHLGSNTKAMTSTTVGLLIQDGLFSWTSNLGELLGNTGVGISDAFSNVTVEQLCTHVSGVSDAPVVAERATLLASYNLTAAEGRAQFTNFTLSRPPVGIQGVYEYSNIGYVILGFILDTATGQTAEEVIQNRLWEPLGITSGGFGPVPESSLTSIDNPWPHLGAPPYGDGVPTAMTEEIPLVQRDNPPFYHTPGSSYMTLADYGRWLSLHHDPAVQARANVSDALLRKLHEVNSQTGSEAYTYGAWGRQNVSDGYYLSHDGSNTFNYATAEVAVTPERLAAVAVTNVGGQEIVSESAWVGGTHEVREGLMDGKIAF